MHHQGRGKAATSSGGSPAIALLVDAPKDSTFPGGQGGSSARSVTSIRVPLGRTESCENTPCDQFVYGVRSVLFRIAKNEKTSQTDGHFDSLSIGGSIESLSDAEDQANQAKNQETPRRGSQVSEEDEEARREIGQCGRPEEGTSLAIFSMPTRELKG